MSLDKKRILSGGAGDGVDGTSAGTCAGVFDADGILEMSSSCPLFKLQRLVLLSTVIKLENILYIVVDESDDMIIMDYRIKLK